MSGSTAVSTEAFLQSIGVNTHLDETWTSFANTAEVESELNYLGVKNVRDSMEAPTDGTLFQAVAAATGVKFDVYLSESAFSADGQMAEMAANANIIKFVEGENEADTWPITYHGLTGFAAIAATQRALYTMATTTPTTAGIGIIGPSYGQQSSFALASNTAATSNYGNIHEYWGTGNPPGGAIPGMVANAQIVSGSNPIVATEAGYYTGASLEGSGQYDQSGVDQLVQAKYDLTTLFDNWQNGVQNTYLYDLMDTVADPSNTNFEDHFGLFNSNGTPKLAAVAIHNLFTILGDSGTVTSTGTLGYQITGMPTTGDSMLMEKSTGVYDLALWNDVRLWSATSPGEIINPAVPITVNFGQTVKSVYEYSPIYGTGTYASWSNVSSISLGLVDHPIILEVTPYAAAGTLSLSSFVLPETVASGQVTNNLWSQILANATESNPSELSSVAISSVGTSNTSGSVSFNAATHMLAYQAPAYNPLHPSDSFTYTLTDGQGDKVTGTVAITETPPADTTYGMVVGARLNAPSSGWTLDSVVGGESLYGVAAGGVTFVGASDTNIYGSGANNTITAASGNHYIGGGGNNANITLGNGNNTISLTGSGNTVVTGNGNNLVWKSLGTTSITMGNGNQSITLGGLNNTISIGTGVSTISAGADGNPAGYENVTVAGGTNNITVGGAKDTVTVGGGAGNAVVSTGGSAKIVIDGGTNNVVAQNGSNIISLIGGTNTIAVSGNANIISGGNGNDSIYAGGNANSIVMGNGNQSITVVGLNNTISTGTGINTISAGCGGSPAGYESVTVGSGTNKINVGGANDTVTVGGGTGNAVVSTGGSAQIVVDSGTNNVVAQNGTNTISLIAGANTVAVSGNTNIISGGTGTDSIWAGGNTTSIVAGAGTESITITGQSDCINLTAGSDTLNDQGSHNTIVLSAAPGTAAQINGNVISAGDTFDLRTALAATTWSGSMSTLSSYLSVTDVGSKSMIFLSESGSGAGSEIAVLNNSSGLTYQGLLAHSTLPASGNATTSTAAAVKLAASRLLVGDVSSKAVSMIGHVSAAEIGSAASTVLWRSTLSMSNAGDLLVHMSH